MRKIGVDHNTAGAMLGLSALSMKIRLVQYLLYMPR